MPCPGGGVGGGYSNSYQYFRITNTSDDHPEPEAWMYPGYTPPTAPPTNTYTWLPGGNGGYYNGTFVPIYYTSTKWAPISFTD